MKSKQVPEPHKTGNQIVEEKVRIANAYAKPIDIKQLQETIEKVGLMPPNKKAEIQQRTSAS